MVEKEVTASGLEYILTIEPAGPGDYFRVAQLMLQLQTNLSAIKQQRLFLFIYLFLLTLFICIESAKVSGLVRNPG